jgi:streptogramin lyase
MSCAITTGRKEPCKNSIAGIHSVYFSNYGTATYTIGADDSVTAMAGTWYCYDVKGGSNLTQNIVASRDNGTTLFDQVLTLQLKKLSPTDNKELKLLAYGRPQIVVADNSGNSWFVGARDGADVTGGTIVTGTAKGDLYGYTLTFTAQEGSPANFVTGSSYTSPFGTVTGTNTIVSGSNT